MNPGLSPTLILSVIAAYFLVLIGISLYTGRKADSQDFFIAGRKAPWFIVAIGMIGASMSGVTFISIPGAVGAGGLNSAFSYMQVVMGYMLGYAVIALVLMPLYYKLNLTSIYAYLGKRFGYYSNKTGAAYFLLSRVIGASFRLFLVAIVLDKFVLGVPPLNVPFEVTVIATIVLIWVYTFKGGIKTIIWTDTLQTIMFLVAMVATMVYIAKGMDTDLGGLISTIRKSDYSKVFFFENGWSDPNYFFKQFFSGALITIVMTGLDQDMMQKNLSCPNIKDAQKNMFTFSGILFFTNLLVLSLGAALYLYANHHGIETPGRSDYMYPTIALNHLPTFIGLTFILGLIAAAYSSADSALTALTTSFCVDFLNFEESEKTEAEKRKVRRMVHVGFSLLLLVTILIFNALNDDAVINSLFKAAGYTYGPLLGLFTFGMLSKRAIRDKWVIAVCLAAPVLTWIIVDVAASQFNFKFGFLNLALNGLLTIAGLYLISKPEARPETA
ncbi:MAG: sodium:solute symporter [Saprospirales bacterium]|nr:sodium:solute symporter [Saprospirales bacterium]